MPDVFKHQGLVSLSSLPAFCFFFFFAVLVYGTFGSPTPDSPGAPEILIGICLMAAVGIQGLRSFLDVRKSGSKFIVSLQILFLLGLTAPFFSALYFGNDGRMVVRDVAAFLFLGLPLFLSYRFQLDSRITKIFLFLILFCGFVFSIRTLIPIFNIWIPQGELLYLSNSPLVIFTAVFLIGRVWSFLEELKPSSVFKTIIYFFLLVVILMAMLLDMQRATVGAVFLSLVICILVDVWVKPKKAILPFAVICAFLVLFSPWVITALEGMAMKTAQVGMNARISEVLSVYALLQEDIVSFLFGRGWGSVFSSPAVAGLDVTFTHSWLSTIFLKGGLLLLLPAIAVVVTALHEIFLIFQRDKVLGLALGAAFLIPVLLYASHKSLDFGLILLMISVWRSMSASWTNHLASDRKEIS